MCNGNEASDVFSSVNSIHVAPEIYTFEPVTDAVDWWCFGAILYELLVGMPLCTIHPDGLTSYTNLKIPKYVSPEGRSLLRQVFYGVK
jgi:serine/threonine protein kinase